MADCYIGKANIFGNLVAGNPAFFIFEIICYKIQSFFLNALWKLCLLRANRTAAGNKVVYIALVNCLISAAEGFCVCNKFFKGNLEAFIGKRLNQKINNSKVQSFFQSCRIICSGYHNNFTIQFFFADFLEGFNTIQ